MEFASGGTECVAPAPLFLHCWIRDWRLTSLGFRGDALCKLLLKMKKNLNIKMLFNWNSCASKFLVFSSGSRWEDSVDSIIAHLVMEFGQNLWRQLQFFFIAQLGIGDWGVWVYGWCFVQIVPKDWKKLKHRNLFLIVICAVVNSWSIVPGVDFFASRPDSLI